MLAVCVSANHRYVQTFLSARVSMWQHCVYGLLVTKTKPASVAQSRLETSLNLVRNSFLSRVSVTVSAGNIRLLIESLQFWSMVSSLCWHETWIYLCFQHFNMSFLWRRLLLHMFCFSDLHHDGELRPVPGEAGQSGLMVPGCPSICPEQLFRVRDPRQRAAVRVWREGGREGERERWREGGMLGGDLQHSGNNLVLLMLPHQPDSRPSLRINQSFLHNVGFTWNHSHLW